MCKDTIVLIISTLLPIALLFYFVQDAQHNMITYFNKQVIGSIENIQTVDSRFSIVWKFIENIIIPLAISLLVLIISYIKGMDISSGRRNWHQVVALFSIVLAGVLPIMISLKQSSFYILTVYPIFAVALGYFIYPLITKLYLKLKTNTKGYRIFKGVTWLVICASVVLSVAQFNRVGRDKAMISDCKRVIAKIGRNQPVGISESMYRIWILHAYMSRYGNLSLDVKNENTHRYYLLKGSSKKTATVDNCALVPLELNYYKLYVSNSIKK